MSNPLMASKRFGSTLHESRGLRYRQIFKILPISKADFLALDDDKSPGRQALRDQRVAYEELKQDLAAASASGAGSNASNVSARSNYRPSFGEVDPVFFQSASTRVMTSNIIKVYESWSRTIISDLSLPCLCPGASPLTVALDLSLILLYVFTQRDYTDEMQASCPIPSIADSPPHVEHDAYAAFKVLYPVVSSLSSDFASNLFTEQVGALVNRTDPTTLEGLPSPPPLWAGARSSPVSPLPALLAATSLFVGSTSHLQGWILPIWDDLFEQWAVDGVFDASAGGGSTSGAPLPVKRAVRSGGRPLSSASSFDDPSSDPLGVGGSTTPRASGGSADAADDPQRPSSERALPPPPYLEGAVGALAPIVVAVFLAAHAAGRPLLAPTSSSSLSPSSSLMGADDEDSSSVSVSAQRKKGIPPLQDLFPTPPHLMFASRVYRDPRFSQLPKRSTSAVASYDPTHLNLVSHHLQLSPDLLKLGVDVVVFYPGPLGLLLRHASPTIGLVVNSFQGSSGQAQASNGVMIGDVIAAVNGCRVPPSMTAQDLVARIGAVGRPVSITFAHCSIIDGPSEKPKICVADEYELPLLYGEVLLDVLQAQMKAAVYGMAECAGGMSGIGITADESSALHHLSDSSSSSSRGGGSSYPYSSSGSSAGSAPSAGGNSWAPGIAMVSGALFVTSYRVVFHQAKKHGLTVAKSATRNVRVGIPSSGSRPRRESKSPIRTQSSFGVSGTAAARAREPPPPDVEQAASPEIGAERGRSPTTLLPPPPPSSSRGTSDDSSKNLPDPDDWIIPLTCILKVDSVVNDADPKSLGVPFIVLKTKDGRFSKIEFPSQMMGNNSEFASNLARTLEKAVFKGSGDNEWGAFPLLHKAAWRKSCITSPVTSPEVASGGKATVFGPAEFSLLAEYERIGLLNESSGLRCVKTAVDLFPNAPTTYPDAIMIPAGMTNDELKKVCAYRSKGRIPSVVYLHKSTNATISRSSQPLVGFTPGYNGFGIRCLEDEKLLARIMNLVGKPRFFYIMDARKKEAATGNRFMGKGTEDVKNYHSTIMVHMDIANIHSVRESETAVWELCRPTSTVGSSDGFYGKLEATKWLQHVHSVLTAGARCAAIVSQEGASVLVHCSDGWDRTAQICGLAQILIDPYYRTFTGFRAIIEKEWLDFGHKFADRCGRGVSGGGTNDDERSPIFALWLDCVWQCMRQFPEAFEFNENLLLALLDQLHAGRCGTFLCNSRKERVEENLFERTMNVWEFFEKTGAIPSFVNKLYVKDDPNCQTDLRPSCNPKNVKFFEPYFLRFDTSIVPYKSPVTYF